MKKWIVVLSESNTSCVSCYGRGNINSPCDECQFIFIRSFNEDEKMFQNIIDRFETYNDADIFMSKWLDLHDFQNQ